jgi:hypothetical protein
VDKQQLAWISNDLAQIDMDWSVPRSLGWSVEKGVPMKTAVQCLFAAMVFIVGVISFLAIAGTQMTAMEKAAPTCKSDWTKCTDNADMANTYDHWSYVQVDCKMEADKLARFGTPEWPWLPFGHFRPGTNYNTGIVTLIEPKAKFQNGFGAMAHSQVTCIYDLHTKKVISVDIS